MVMALAMPFMVHGLVASGQVHLAWYLTLALMVAQALFSVMINTLLTGFIAQLSGSNTSFMSLFMVG